MENKAFFIQYLTNKPVKVQTHIDSQRVKREFPLTDVADLIVSYKAAVAPRFDSTPTDELTLHLPEGVSRSALTRDCFATVDENDTTLDAGCLVSDLHSLGSKSKQPLIIKSVSVRINDFLPPSGQPKPILLQREQNQAQIAETAMDIDISPFDSDIYHSKNNSCFPFFDPVIEKYLRSLGEDALLARDDSIKKVNHVIAYRDVEKYQPIICSTSRGMGKTAFLEAIGMQLVKECLQNNLILDALKYGRILSFDFAGVGANTAMSSLNQLYIPTTKNHTAIDAWIPE